MLNYIIRRLFLIIPTLFGIMVLNFLIVQAAPGGPVEQVIAKLQGHSTDATSRVNGSGSENMQAMTQPGEKLMTNTNTSSRYKGAQGLDPEFIKELEVQFGFDKPMHERFLLMIGHYIKFDFGKSYFRDQKVIDLVLEKMPVSISLGLWTTLLIYLISIPLGIRKAVKDGSNFDIWTSTVIII